DVRYPHGLAAGDCEQKCAVAVAAKHPFDGALEALGWQRDVVVAELRVEQRDEGREVERGRLTDRRLHAVASLAQGQHPGLPKWRAHVVEIPRRRCAWPRSHDPKAAAAGRGAQTRSMR